MSDSTLDAAAAAQNGARSGKLGLILGLVLAIAGAGGGFLAVRSGLLFGGDGSHAAGLPDRHGGDDGDPHAGAATDIAFVEVEPVLISLHDTKVADYLRFRMQLEVASAHRAEVEHLLPRIIDLLNGYLRALAPEDFEDPLILPRLRSQILRRVQIAAGPGRVNDVLIMEFVLD